MYVIRHIRCNLLTGKGLYRVRKGAGEGEGIVRAGEGIVRAGEGEQEKEL